MSPDIAKLGDELVRFADGIIGLRNFIHFLLEMGWDEAAAKGLKITLGIREFFKVICHESWNR